MTPYFVKAIVYKQVYKAEFLNSKAVKVTYLDKPDTEIKTILYLPDSFKTTASVLNTSLVILTMKLYFSLESPVIFNFTYIKLNIVHENLKIVVRRAKIFLSMGQRAITDETRVLPKPPRNSKTGVDG